MNRKLHGLVSLLFCCLILQAHVYAQVVSTFAGSGAASSIDGTGTGATIQGPNSLVADGSGNLYVTAARKIRKITPAGVVTTLAGSGSFGGTDGTGAAASFDSPTGIVIDGSGNLFVADRFIHKIRKITPGGVVTTFAGTDGVAGSTDATGTAAKFNAPAGLAIDGSNNIYVADFGNNKIRKITPLGVVTTFAGSGTLGSTNATGIAASFDSPYSICIDGSGNLYVGDLNNKTIRKITSSAVVTTFAGVTGLAGNINGASGTARLTNPYGIAVDGSGNVYFSDQYWYNIRKSTPTGFITTIAGTTSTVKPDTGSVDGPGAVSTFYQPLGIAFSNGSIYIADNLNNKIRKLTGLCSSTTPAAPTVTITQPTCAVPSGTVVITAPTGAIDYSIGGTYQSSTTFSGITPSTFDVLARNTTDNACISAATSVTINAIPSVPATPTASATLQPTCATPTGTIVITAPTGSVNYSIGGAYQASTTFAGVAPSTVTITAKSTTDNTCISSSTAVTINPVPTVPSTPTVTVTQPTCGVPSGTIVVLTPITSVDYSIGGAYQEDLTFLSITPRTASVTARSTLDLSCISSPKLVTINAVPSNPTTPIGITTIQPTCLLPTGTIVLTAPTGALEYAMDGGAYQTSMTFTLASPGNAHTFTARNTVDNTCISASSTISVNAIVETQTVTAPSDITFCGTTTQLTGASISSNFPFLWEYVSGTVVSIQPDENAKVPTIVFPSAGNGNVTLRLKSPGCNTNDLIVVTQTNAGVPVASIPQKTLITSATSNIDFSPSITGTVTWDISGTGTVSTSAPYNYQPSALDLTNGAVEIVANVQGTGACNAYFASDTIKVILTSSSGLHSLSGTITNSVAPTTQNTLQVFKLLNGYWVLLKDTVVNNSGYTIPNLTNGEYKLLVLTNDIERIDTYYGDFTKWGTASSISINNADQTGLAINIQQYNISAANLLAYLNGSNRVAGRVTLNTTASISGLRTATTDPVNIKPVDNASVNIYDNTGNSKLTTTQTNTNGFYIIDNMQASQVEIEAQYPGTVLEGTTIANPSQTQPLTIVENADNIKNIQLVKIDDNSQNKLTAIVSGQYFSPNSNNIYPNPAKNEVYIRLKDELKNQSRYKIIVFDGAGKPVQTNNYEGAAEILKLDISGLEKGLFQIYINAGNKSMTEKLVAGE